MSDDNFDYGQLRFDDGDGDDDGGGTAGLHADKALSKSSAKKGDKADKSGKPDRLQKLSDAIGDFNRVTGVFQTISQEFPTLGQFNKKLEVVLLGLGKRIADVTARVNSLDSRLATISSSVDSEARDTRTTYAVSKTA
jgi:hypothetical protein